MDSHDNKLLGLLSNHNVTFFIPPYQRNYEWDREHCEAFLNDVMKTAQSNLSGEYTEHFFGSVTFFQDEAAFGQPHKLVLIDGQQRITTVMLFLAAVRDLTTDEDAKEHINDNYLKNPKASDADYKIKLKQAETDWKAYCDVIFNKEPEDDGRNSAIFQNYLFFKRRLSADGKDAAKGFELIQYGLDKFRVITIELQPKQNKWENPQEIFESMNSLGKSLSLADLVRNYLLLGMSADKQQELYNAYWLKMEKRLSNISDFIRDFMQLKDKRAYSKATERNYKALYADFKSLFSKSKTAELIQELSAYSKHYACIAMGAASGNPAIDARLNDIRHIGVSTSYSFLMGLMVSWKEGRLSGADMLRLLDVLLTYFLRRRILGLTAAENKNIPALAAKIPDIEQAPDKTAYLYRLLSNQESNLRVPNDTEMERQMSTMNFFNFQYVKFVLALTEESLTRSRPALNDVNLTIEHIMPQTLNAHWKEALKDDPTVYDEFVHNIGNLTLIRHNRELGQKPFSEKKKIYEENAGLQIARTEITNRDKWDRASIENRAKWLIAYILKFVLPIPDEMRHANNFSAKKSHGLSFEELSLIGKEITFVKDASIKAKVVSDNEALFEGKTWRLSPLTRELETRRGTVNKSGAYQGAAYWEYNGIRLIDMM